MRGEEVQQTHASQSALFIVIAFRDGCGHVVTLVVWLGADDLARGHEGSTGGDLAGPNARRARSDETG